MQPKMVFTTIKRSPAMTQHEATTIAKESHLFGYEPEVVAHMGKFHLIIRGDGSDDISIEHRLIQLRGDHRAQESSGS